MERENKPRLLNRLNRIEGQVRGIARMGARGRAGDRSRTPTCRRAQRNSSTGIGQVRSIVVVVLPTMSWRMRECP